ncbi:hypothetical protein GCM10010872_23380 [Dyella flava]|uniref:Uncharacterized protein n=1 Tax=Dyella flava TaxID=1920170 RepID=A0ABS2K114_9GAMM|nr:alpha/beta hydrolase [Dyella flava]MBM7124846.1 hypothetical protein [Dyella flava]GLQ50889.1 hypothetical protein GCM10010872_23380 [Dyella flava]
MASCEQVLTGRTLSARDLEQIVEDSLRGAPAAKIAWAMSTIMEDITAAVAHIAVPVLIIAGELDKIDPVGTLKSDVLARIKGATMQTLPGVGHLSPLEAPRDIADAVAEFARGL